MPPQVGYTEDNPFQTPSGRVYGADGQLGTGAPAVQALAAALGGGGSTPNAGALDPNSGMMPATGWAAQQGYTPQGLKETYENPWNILMDVFKGIDTSSPGYQGLRDLGADPLTLFNITQGSGKKIDQGGSDFVNWLANMYKQQGTRGGQSFDALGMIKTLFGNADNEKNTLGQIMTAGGGSDQTRTLFNMLRDVSNVGMNPLAARGYQAAVSRAGDEYGNAMMKTDAGKSVGPAEWIAQNMPWLSGK